MPDPPQTVGKAFAYLDQRLSNAGDRLAFEIAKIV